MNPSSAGSTDVSGSRNRLAFEPSNSIADYDALLTRIPTIDDVLDGHASALGNDRVAYRNHVYRVVNLCVAIVGGRSEVEKIAAAAVFHDLGIWTNRTFDYIAPSIALARKYLVARALEDWIDVTGGLRRFGIPRPFVARLFATWPDAGFHWRLVQLALHRFRTHPLSPLPMVRL